MDSGSNSEGSKEVPPSVLPRAQTPANTTASEPLLPAAAVTARSTNAAAWRRVPTPLSPHCPCLTPRATQLGNVTQTANLRGGALLPSFTLLTPVVLYTVVITTTLLSGLIPARPSSFESALTLDATRDPTYQSGFWTHDVPGGMHYQGRRWGFSPADIYDTANTFKSYGIEGPAEGPELREELLAAVPVAHKELLAGMHWVVELECTRFDGHDPLKIVCVHAGLSADKDAAAQLEALRLRDWRMPVLHERGQVARIEAFSGRTTVLRNHPALVEGNVVLVSGHHGTCIIDRSDQRAIVDEHGGLGPIQAIIFPEWEVISS